MSRSILLNTSVISRTSPVEHEVAKAGPYVKTPSPEVDPRP